MYSITSYLLALAILSHFDAEAQESAEVQALTSQSKSCTYNTVYEMYGAHCVDLGYKELPSNLKTDIEILDFSENNMQMLTNNPFSRHTSLRLLYLADNKITVIEENTFSVLPKLQSLDLSRNVITHVPNSIFQLPSLKKLLLNGNLLMTMDGSYISKPIKAPLEYLDLADCRLNKIWNWGILPQLLFYNISHNPLISIETSHFVDMCNIRSVDLTGSIDSMRTCYLKNPIKWLKSRRVEYLVLDDSAAKLKSREFASCPESTIPDNLNATYHQCLSAYKIPSIDTPTSRRTWLTIGGGLLGFLVSFMLLLYVFHRYNVAKIRREVEKKKIPPVPGEKQSSQLLLNEASTA